MKLKTIKNLWKRQEKNKEKNWNQIWKNKKIKNLNWKQIKNL
jgi:hypothetical protein